MKKLVVLIALLLLVIGHTLAQNRTGRITDDVSSQRFNIGEQEADTTLTVRLIPITGDLIPIMGLVPEGENRPVASTQAVTSTPIELEHTLDEDGSYDVVITREDGPRGNTAGDFILILGSDTPVELERNLPSSDSEQVVIRPSAIIRGTLPEDVPFHLYYIYLEVDEVIQVQVGYSEDNFVPRVLLQNEDGRTLEQNIGQEGTATFQHTVAEAGWHSVAMTHRDPEDTQTGLYQMSVVVEPD